MDGILIVNKGKDFTSFDVVNKLRGILHERRIGHTGTLDPQATGVLIVLVGKATKAMPFLVTHNKEYVAKLRLGIKTSTGDIWGETIETQGFTKPDESEIATVLKGFVGKSKQMPPMVSAIRVNGKHLYEYARQGKEIDRTEREIEITDIELVSVENEIMFRVVCSSGTYIRTLCEDIAAKLHTIGSMSELVRTKVEHYTLNDAFTLDQISAGEYTLLPLSTALAHIPSIEVEELSGVMNGVRMKIDTEEPLIVLTHLNESLAVYERREDGLYHCVRGLW